MCDHGSIGLPLGMGSFGGFFGFCVFLAFSFSVFVLCEANKSPTHRILVGNQREKTTFRLWFPFLSFVHLVTIPYCSDIVMQSYPARALDRKLQVDWAKNAREALGFL